MRLPVFVLSAAVLAAACSSGAATTSPSAAAFNAASAPVQTPAVGASATIGAGPTASPVDISSWIEVAPEGQGFGVPMPGKATKSTMTIPAVNAPTTIWTYTDDSGRAFQVARSKYPKGALAGTSKVVLDSIAKGMTTWLADSTLQRQTDVTIGGHAGRRYLLVSPKSNAEGIFVVAGDFVFTVCLTYEPGNADPGLIEAFLGSFMLSV